MYSFAHARRQCSGSFSPTNCFNSLTFASSMAHVRLFKQFVGEKLPAHCRLA